MSHHYDYDDACNEPDPPEDEPQLEPSGELVTEAWAAEFGTPLLTLEAKGAILGGRSTCPRHERDWCDKAEDVIPF